MHKPKPEQQKIHFEWNYWLLLNGFSRRFYYISTGHRLLSMGRVKYDKRRFYQEQNCWFDIFAINLYWQVAGIACDRLNVEQISCKWINNSSNSNKNNAKVIYVDGKTSADPIVWSVCKIRKIVRESHYQVVF